MGETSPIDVEKSAVEPSVEQEGRLSSCDKDMSKSTDADGTGPDDSEVEYPSGVKVALIMISNFLAVFLVALDRTIVATALPQISNDFHSLNDIGWYGSAYMLTSCAFQLFFGRIYTFYSTKWVFLAAILLFEIGSALCGAAPTSVAFIVGRAIAGMGSAGVFSGVIVIITQTIPLAKRGAYQGGFGAVFGIASIIGPLLGGTFTTHATWRWCFYINLPIGAITIVIIALILHVPAPQASAETIREKINQLDPIGTALFIPGVVCLLLVLQWGGSTYSWSSSRIIILFVLAGLLLLGFIGVQVWKQENATVPPRIIMQRSVASGVFFAFCVGGAMMILVYFVAIWFQAIEDITAYESGIRMLPLVLALVVGSGMSGGLVSAAGYYTPFMILGTLLMAVGGGLLTTFHVETTKAQWIGYQALFGFGLGMAMQMPSIAAQTVLRNADVPIGASLMFFAQWLGGAIFVSVGQNVLTTKLVSGLASIPGFDPKYVTSYGATDLRTFVPQQVLAEVLGIYNGALVKVFEVALILSCLSVFGAVAMEWRSVKKEGSGGW